MNCELTDDGMRTDSYVIAYTYEERFGKLPEEHAGIWYLSRAEIKALIAPVEGEAAAYEHFCMKDESGICLVTDADEPTMSEEFDQLYNWRVIIICKTVGELRELDDWAGGE